MADNNKTNTFIIDRPTETQFLMHQTEKQRNNQQAKFAVPIHFIQNINNSES